MEIKIGGRIINQSSEPFVIAEAGINHNGDLAIAKQMVLLAKESGCDAVKFQTFKASEFCGDPDQTISYFSQGKKVTESMLEMFRRHEFTPAQWQALKHYCDKQEICFLSTPQNSGDLDLLLNLGVDAIKIGSDDFTNIPLLKEYRRAGLPLILSCGMSSLAEIHNSLEVLDALKNPEPGIVLCLCTSQYPTPSEDVNLLKLQTLRQVFSNIVLGFSDHTQGSLASSLAVALGSVVFEKHFTLDNQMSGPDHWFSENPESLKEWVHSIHLAYTLMGSRVVVPTAAEKQMRVLARRSIVAIADIKVGDILDAGNIGLRRPGNGLSPDLFEKVVGQQATRNISSSELLRLGDFCHGK